MKNLRYTFCKEFFKHVDNFFGWRCHYCDFICS